MQTRAHERRCLPGLVLSGVLRSQHGLGFAQVEHDSQGVESGFSEAVAQVEVVGARVDGVAQQHSRAYLLRRAQRAQCGILQKVGTKPPALPQTINRQSPQQHGRHRLRHVAANRTPNVPSLHAAGSQRVEARYAISITCDEAARTAYGLIVPRMPA